jgi:hypothetical protein
MKANYSKHVTTNETFTINDRITFVYKDNILKEVIYRNTEGTNSYVIDGQEFIEIREALEYTNKHYEELRAEGFK